MADLNKKNVTCNKKVIESCGDQWNPQAHPWAIKKSLCKATDLSLWGR